MTYAVVKSLHLVAVIVWMAGMLFAPALIVALGRLTGEARLSAARGCRRLYRLLSTPGMLAAWVFGLGMLTWGGWMQSGWMIAKLALVIVLSAVHGLFSGLLRRVETDATYRPPGWVAALVPTQIGVVFLVVGLVVTKPI